jgi:hypothetical protein
VFVVEIGVGIVRATHPQIAALSTKQPIDKIGRTVRRAKKREQLVNIQALSDDERLAFNVGRAVLGAVEQAVRQAMRRKERFKKKMGRFLSKGRSVCSISFDSTERRDR